MTLACSCRQRSARRLLFDAPLSYPRSVVAVRDPEVGAALLASTEMRRIATARELPPTGRAQLGQFFTPAPVADIIAGLADIKQPRLRVLDPGAGVGSLAASVVARAAREAPELVLDITAVEVEPLLAEPLAETLRHCERVGQGKVTCHQVQEDFLTWAADRLPSSLSAQVAGVARFDVVVMNPPYRKINNASAERRVLAQAGVETTNLYTAFLALGQNLLDEGGQLVAITPRSFCNGTYFRGFRQRFLNEMALRAIHVFESRKTAFAEDDVLQENVIFAATKSVEQSTVMLSASDGHEDDLFAVREVPYSDVVRPDDPESFIHIVIDKRNAEIARRMSALPCLLKDLGLTVSTGRVVDFRAREHLRSLPVPGSVPLIYQGHVRPGGIEWPSDRVRKPQSITVTEDTRSLFLPRGHYVLTKRFTAKEERRRVVAGVFDPETVPGEVVAFENHTNVFHEAGKGLPVHVARGVAAFLNSGHVDTFFRQFSGHTQVNSGDLRSLRYPTRDELERLGAALPAGAPDQEALDRLVQEHVPALAGLTGEDSLSVQRKMAEALAILEKLEMPREQQNERSALTLLALCGLHPDDDWSSATAPLCGITPMMAFFAEQYGKNYAPNTRETVRRKTVHQFMAAGLIVHNPDRPDRPVNSPKATYQIEQSALKLLQSFGHPGWDDLLAAYKGTRQSLVARWATERDMNRIPVVLPDGSEVTLSPGGQNVLIKEVVDGFCSRFTPGGQVLYVGDADEKWAVYDEAGLRDLGVTIEEHGKMPDLVVYYGGRDWLVLVEAVTSHGPVNGKRHEELRQLFRHSTVGLVFVTAFLDRRTMAKYLPEISWETEVWCADSPSHLIHFNGWRFLGPYE